MLHEALAGRVVVDDGHVLRLERVQHGDIDLDQGAVLPQRRRRARVQLHPQRHRLCRQMTPMQVLLLLDSGLFSAANWVPAQQVGTSTR